MKGFFALPRQIKLGELLRFVSIQLLVTLRIQLPVHFVNQWLHFCLQFPGRKYDILEGFKRRNDVRIF